MNELLQELYQKSFSTYQAGVGFDTKIVQRFDLEKFSKLIVEECMKCSDWVGQVNKNSVEPVNTAHAINLRIKQRFGIKE